MKRTAVIAICIFLAGNSELRAASRANINWFFGGSGGLTFADGTPQPLSGGQINAIEGCATISDADGNLLFYTNGDKVWNSSHSVMPNGTGLLGDAGSTQSAIVVPKPGTEDHFYIFTTDAFPGGVDGMNFTEIDMSLDGGNGDVVTGNKNINLMTACSEQIGATTNADNSGFWVLGRAINSNAIHAFQVTSFGVDTTPIISSVGTSTGILGELGYLKPSPSGASFVMCWYINDTVELYDFNQVTGVISNPVNLGSITGPYGAEFSADGKRLYVSSIDTDSIFQFNMEAGDIAGSNTTIASMLDTPAAMQLGPDGKIYVARNGTALSVINSPEALGTGCNFQDATIAISGLAAYGLPTYIHSFLYPKSMATVTTTAATSIATTTATSGGNVTDNGNASVTARGVCWSTSQNPTTADSKTSNGTGSGSFTANLTGLTANTTYYIRAYATNSEGTAYGSQKQFKTSAVTTTAPDVRMSITGSDNSLNVGETTSFNIDLENVGDGSAEDVEVTFEIPENTEFVSLEIDDSTARVINDVDVDGRNVSANLGDLDPSAEMKLILNLKVIKSGSVTVKASASGGGISTEVTQESDAVESNDQTIRVVQTIGPAALCGTSFAGPMAIGALLLLGQQTRRRNRRRAA